ncbi:hypothetical protein FHX42_003773 [Saccharopolyspora lacisalsi]|uniref:Uncharacterized protein n=1 Tax=Halosaccharopolyspora lacisalsi TaxID=1000566 RepID=A0A839E3T9_9PSEU|nr:hypothetical protein [Halosaccharopolyspora lacisalsi]
MVVLAVELGQFGLEVGTHSAHDLFAPVQVGAGEHRMPVLRDENQVRVHGVHDVSTSSEVVVICHEDNSYNSGQ